MSNLIISNEAKIKYLDNLMGRMFKILPLYEEKNNEIPMIYINAQMIDVASANNLFNGILIDLIIKLNTLCGIQEDHSFVRKTVFECTNIITRIKKELVEDVVS